MTNYRIKILDHLGLLSSMCDELQISDIVDRNIEQDFSKRHISAGTCVKAMILEGLGFLTRTLYLSPAFFENKPTGLLLGKNIEAKHINQYVLVRALDEVYHHGINKIFSEIAVNTCKVLGLSCKYGHLDITSFHTHGKYNSEDALDDDCVVHITKGYSRYHRNTVKLSENQ